jgi:CDP-paratose 2-epimerase
MKTVLITGSAGLTGAEAVAFYCERDYRVIGIDNDMRAHFFGGDASTDWNRKRLLERYSDTYTHYCEDIRDQQRMEQLFDTHGSDIDLIIHAAAQPSHDWAVKEPFTDFTVNANGTLVILECARRYCPHAVFVFCSTNKVYGDTPNKLPLVELDQRWEIADKP